MKNIRISLFALLLLTVAACSKKKDSTTTPVTPVTPTSPYYFKFNMNGVAYNYNQNIPQYMPFYANEAGGYEVATAALWPSVGLRLSWPSNDTVKESDLLGLIGKTLYFTDTAVHPEISWDSTTTSAEWFSVDTANTANYVKITNVTYLKKDTTAGYNVATYVITGNCNALIDNGTSRTTLSGGDFKFIISRRDL